MADADTHGPPRGSVTGSVDNSWRGGIERSYGHEAPAAPDPDRPPAVRVEVVVIGGDEGRWLATRQATVIKEALEGSPHTRARTSDPQTPPAA
jgi:hypothetical protein